MCSTTVELSVIVPSASPRISHSRPRGESASICQSGPYVGHVGRQKPQWVHASISSRWIATRRTRPLDRARREAGRATRSARPLGSLSAARVPRPRSRLRPAAAPISTFAASTCAATAAELPSNSAATRSSVTSSALGTSVDRRTRSRLLLRVAGRHHCCRGLGQRVQPQAHAHDDRRACHASRRAACRGRSLRRSSRPCPPSSRRARRRRRR